MRLTTRNTLAKRRTPPKVLADTTFPLAISRDRERVTLSFYGTDDATRYSLDLTTREVSDLVTRLVSYILWSPETGETNDDQ